MELRVFTEPQQGASYEDQLRVAKAAEEYGYAAFFRSDHYLSMGSASGLPGPTDSWVTLAGLARETQRIRLGTLVSSMTFRFPGPLAISVAQVDQMSGGRVELGLGTGWYEQEHAAYGIPFPAKRFGPFAEQLDIVKGLWTTPTGESFSYQGEHYTVTDSPALPKPAQVPHPPIIIGGGGANRTPRLAAQHAAEFNLGFGSPESFAPKYARVREVCAEAGRDPRTLALSAALVICVGKDEKAVADRAAVLGREVPELKQNGLAGSPSEVADRIGQYAELGVSRIYLQLLDLTDIDQLELIASDVKPQVRDL